MQKSLDAVIRGYEACNALDCRICPYGTDKYIDEYGKCLCDPDDKDDDALYYLKEYRDQKNNLEKEIAYWKRQSQILVETIELLKGNK